MIIYETGNIAKYSIICMFRKHFEAIVPFSEIIFVLLQVYLPILYILYGKEICKQIEDNVGSNQALKQVVGRNVG